MIYLEKIISIQPNYNVLEIGPGASPHKRSNIFLELFYESDSEGLAQRGGLQNLSSYDSKKLIYYDGGRFPFDDNVFDYVICSHVIEHVEDVELFLAEIFRVGKEKGYIEYPLITYEFMYDYDVHLNFIKFDKDENMLMYMKKNQTSLSDFVGITKLLRLTLLKGWDDICDSNKNLFFEGFEFNKSFGIKSVRDINLLLPNNSEIKSKTFIRRLALKLMKILGQ